MLLLRFLSAARLWPSLRCCVLNTAAFCCYHFTLYPLLLRVVLALLFIFYSAFFYWDVRLSVVGAVMDSHV